MNLENTHNNSNIEESDKHQTHVISSDKYDQFFFGRGKLLISGEYLILDGTKGLAVPTKYGQSMGVRYSQSFNPTLHWKSFDLNGNLWFEAKLEFWHFNLVEGELTPEIEMLQKLLRAARVQNKHFLRDEVDVHVDTQLGFPLEWGLGSSSTLIYNIAQWAYVSPFELLFNTTGGSGYDIACAQSERPLVYEKYKKGPHWSPSDFNPSFKDNLYFVYRGQKQDSRSGIARYREMNLVTKEDIKRVSEITDGMLTCSELAEFNALVIEHEDIISKIIDMPPVKAQNYSDYWGEMKSLGAWGGDFMLVTSDKSEEETRNYFNKKGHDVVFKFADLVNNTEAPVNELLH
ncbi:MAG: GHMP kinase [Oligoflexia bacterium]|nr:GHMP kinase [Oligoflexia bacterium]